MNEFRRLWTFLILPTNFVLKQISQTTAQNVEFNTDSQIAALDWLRVRVPRTNPGGGAMNFCLGVQFISRIFFTTPQARNHSSRGGVPTRIP